jgi:hypothetical protein
MYLRQGLSILFLLALGALPVRATDNHEYGKDEYAVIRDGLAPNRRLALAAHGEGEVGDGNFHVWLMAEPAHRKIVVLEGVGENNILDTGPASYHASWSGDSRSVAINFRSSRHIVELNLYRIEDRRARQVTGPTLFQEAAGRDVSDDDDLRSSIPTIVWRGPDRFALTERRLFITRDAGFAGRLGGYARVTEKLDEGRLVVEFSAEADCAIAGGRYRIVNIRVGKFDDAKREGAN